MHFVSVLHLNPQVACSGFLLLQGHLGIHDAIVAARLEETYQMDEWGLVEGGHDIDIADMQVRIAGPTVFLRLLQASP